MLLDDLKEIISIPSTKAPAEDGAPFGGAIRKALDWFLAKAQSFGLRTGELDGVVGWAEYGDPNDECIGVLCHLDVVPAGEGWTHDPYTLTEANGCLYGRGVVDDKGATVACLHALKEIRDEGLKLNRRIRIIAGCDEENGSACLHRYVEHGEIPVMSFVPDSDFPIINSEKGILQLMLHMPKDDILKSSGVSISGGKTINVVPNNASLSIPKNSRFFTFISGISTPNERIFDAPSIKKTLSATGLGAKDFIITNNSDTLVIEAKGVAGHAMAPHNADNALWKIFSFLSCADDYFPSSTVKSIHQFFCSPESAARLGIYKSDEESGDLTISMDIVEDDGDNLHLSIDIRYPISANKDGIMSGIRDKMPKAAKLEMLKHDPNLYIPKDSGLVRSLLAVFHECTGMEPYTLKCGGGTYARRLPNSIAFGPNFPNTTNNIHNADEYVRRDQFEQLPTIYKKAMIALTKEKL